MQGKTSAPLHTPEPDEHEPLKGPATNMSTLTNSKRLGAIAAIVVALCGCASGTRVDRSGSNSYGTLSSVAGNPDSKYVADVAANAHGRDLEGGQP